MALESNNITDLSVRKLLDQKFGTSLSREHVTKTYLGHTSDARQRATLYFVLTDACSRDYAAFIESKYLRLFKEEQNELNIRVVVERDLLAVLPRDAQVIWEAVGFYDR